MRNTLAFVAALVVTCAAVGWYLGWYSVRSHPGAPGKETYQIEINTEKINQDLGRGLRSGEQTVKKWVDGDEAHGECPCKKKAASPAAPAPKVHSHEEAEPRDDTEGYWFRAH